MKITDVKVWLVQGIKYNWTLLKIYTDEGYTGVGEATNWPGSPILTKLIDEEYANAIRFYLDKTLS